MTNGVRRQRNSDCLTKMTRIHFLTEGFAAPNTRAIFFPLIVRRRLLRTVGITWKMYREPKDSMFDCDVLIVESNFHGNRWNMETEGILDELHQYKDKCGRLFYLDASDSTSLLHPEVLPIVDKYLKGQLLVDREQYLEEHYGRRLFTDFAHRKFGIEDKHPENSCTVVNSADLSKLAIWHNSSLADWSPMGKYWMELYARVPFRPLLSFPKHHTAANLPRTNNVSCRMGLNYDRDTVAWHRRVAKDKLTKWAPTNRVSYRDYVREIQSSQMIVSPFGWGEINYKDYETFLAGALLVKPDMTHLETWPSLYRPGETFQSYRWDAEDLPEVIEALLNKPSVMRDMAARGQEFYRDSLLSCRAQNEYCDRLKLLTSG